ncbi:hypothetical protein LSH36_498g00056 [Paralvinella palmiformis]|uniref:Uncharacterized protein n=1 Tax=Paralvinella palmiformis TaxID=53620 RepID=A0AAD9J8U9_9ANNE|nr:hypothetical protein LSH36_498g00056 [Paralvinella palmiformis]
MAEDPSKESLVTDISNGISYLASLDEALHAIMTVITYLQGHLPGSVDHIKTLFSVKCYLADYEGKTERNVNIAPDSLSARIRDDSCENNPDEISSEETVDLLVGDNNDDIMQHVADHEIWDGSQDENRALNTLPSCLSVRTSRVKPAGVGVFTNVCLTESVYFGPYEGETVENPDSCITTSWLWQVIGDDNATCYIDGRDSSKANWMRYVHCTSAENYHNLKAFQYDGLIFYKVTRNISSGTELIVCYQYTHDDRSDPVVTAPHDSPTCVSHIGANCIDTASVNDRNTSEVIPISADVELDEQAFGSKQLSNRSHCWKRRYERQVAKTEHACFNAKIGKFICKNCHKEFTLFSQYRYHERRHTGEKPYQCSDCGRCFRVTGHLRVHQLTHTNNKPYSCHFCARRFTQSSNLTRHLRIHTGEKPHQCLYCEKKFADATTFKCHQRIHTGERPYKCKLCGQGFISSSRRKTHILSHSQLKVEEFVVKSSKTQT